MGGHPSRSSPESADEASARSARTSGRSRALSPPASVPAGLIMSKPVTLRFVFANKDGVTVEHSTDLGTLVSDVKNSLISSWPEGASVIPPSAAHRDAAGRAQHRGPRLSNCAQAWRRRHPRQAAFG